MRAQGIIEGGDGEVFSSLVFPSPLVPPLMSLLLSPPLGPLFLLQPLDLAALAGGRGRDAVGRVQGRRGVERGGAMERRESSR